MELRSAKRNNYKTTLVSIGLYEDGMKLEEMKEMVQALEESQLECNRVFFETDFERAMKKNEGSPEIVSEKFIVQADVHHELNWSPSRKEHNNRHVEKRKSIDSVGMACDIKRSKPPITSSPKLFSVDSENSCVWQSEDQQQVSEVYYSDPSF